MVEYDVLLDRLVRENRRLKIAVGVVLAVLAGTGLAAQLAPALPPVQEALVVEGLVAGVESLQ